MRLFPRLTARPALPGRVSVAASPAVKPLPPKTAARLAATVQPTTQAQPAETASRATTANTALTGEPTGPTERLTAVVHPGRKVLPPGAYTVTYSRLAHHDRTAAPEQLRTRVTNAAGLRAAIAADARRYLDGPGVIQAFVDLQTDGGYIHVDGQPAGTFTYAPTRRKDRTTQNETAQAAAENGAPTA